MVLRILTDFQGADHPVVWSPWPEPAEALLEAAAEAAYLAVGWEDPAALPVLQALAVLGSRLLVPERWQAEFPQAALLISSSISGGDLGQRFREAARRRCWLVPEPLRAAFPLPCPDGQGAPVSEIPKSRSFYSEALGCRYVHEPGRVILFDTEETLENKLLLARECGFLGVFSPAPADGQP